MLFNVFYQGAMARIGILFVDLNTTDRVHKRLQIIQIAAIKLSGNPPYYDDYAIPSVRIHAGAMRYHGITVNHGNMYHEGIEVNNPQKSEEDLLKNFIRWINRFRYDKLFVIHHSSWKRRCIEFRLERYNLRIRPEVFFVDIMQIMQDHQLDLDLNDFSLNGIFRVLDGNRRYRYAFQNAKCMRQCAFTAAYNLQMDVRDFLGGYF